MDVVRALSHWAERIPHAAAVRDEDGDLSWGELAVAARREASRLAAHGVGPGDRVGIVMTNSRQFCVSVLGTLAAGAIVVPMNHRLHAKEMATQLADAEAVAVVHDDVLENVAQQAAGLLGRRPLRSGPEHWGAGAEHQVVRELDDVATILYSSGTTGRPRGAAISHQSIYAMAHDRIVNDGWSRETVTYVPYPLAFSAGLLASWMATMIAGGLTVTDRVFDPSRALRRFEQDRVTVLMAVPAVWQAIVAHPDIDGTDVSSLSTVSAGGAMVTPELMDTLRERGIRLSQGYGLTECSGVATALRPEDIESKPGSVGRPMMLMETRVVREDGTECVPGEPGELLLRGPAVMSGYWRDGRPDPSSLEDGWLRTGDVATRDDDGYLAIVDRIKDLIITGGINVVPAEIERALEAIPGVVECAVVGAPHERWGETPWAFVVTDDPALDAAAIEAALRTQLAGYKIPTRIEIRNDALPRSANGKVLRRVLRTEVSDDAVAAAERPDGVGDVPAEAVTSLVERYFAAVNARDWPAFAATLHPGITVRQGESLSAEGIDKVTALYRAIVAQWQEHEDRPTRIMVDGSSAAVEILFTGRRADGTPVSFSAFDIIDVEDGLIRRVSTWYDTARVVPLITGRAGA